MIQRIQSIYLLVAAIIMAVTFSAPLICQEGFSLFSYGFYNYTSTGEEIAKIPYGILIIGLLAILLPIISIFLFKKRKRQRKFVWTSIIFTIFYMITCLVYMNSFLGDKDFINVYIKEINFTYYLPLIAIIFEFLAIRGINKDEKLIRSVDRIR